MLHLLAFTLLVPLPHRHPVTGPGRLLELVNGFESRGVQIINEHLRCSDSRLHGFYIRGSRQVVICQRGDQSYTLRHEGWHLVQSLCLSGREWLTSPYIEDHLSQQERIELRLFVDQSSWTREAEARVMAQFPPDQYFKALDAACSNRLDDLDQDSS